ncbi:MAG: hypothetical protein EZS28_020157 [Streblomastix strix]|uniref:Nucleoplasmin-like domain-containing protein n=1 Tax=Streblomastix strix TaxID=222440 RepID=A0A5J4VNX6_9EUKA|nr:MAG: hypothetical protein EZS28_020157 [Streblomastix strix]
MAFFADILMPGTIYNRTIPPFSTLSLTGTCIDTNNSTGKATLNILRENNAIPLCYLDMQNTPQQEIDLCLRPRESIELQVEGNANICISGFWKPAV